MTPSPGSRLGGLRSRWRSGSRRCCPWGVPCASVPLLRDYGDLWLEVLVTAPRTGFLMLPVARSHLGQRGQRVAQLGVECHGPTVPRPTDYRAVDRMATTRHDRVALRTRADERRPPPPRSPPCLPPSPDASSPSPTPLTRLPCRRAPCGATSPTASSKLYASAARRCGSRPIRSSGSSTLSRLEAGGGRHAVTQAPPRQCSSAWGWRPPEPPRALGGTAGASWSSIPSRTTRARR